LRPRNRSPEQCDRHDPPSPAAPPTPPPLPLLILSHPPPPPPPQQILLQPLLLPFLPRRGPKHLLPVPERRLAERHAEVGRLDVAVELARRMHALQQVEGAEGKGPHGVPAQGAGARSRSAGGARGPRARCCCRFCSFPAPSSHFTPSTSLPFHFVSLSLFSPLQYPRSSTNRRRSQGHHHRGARRRQDRRGRKGPHKRGRSGGSQTTAWCMGIKVRLALAP